MNEFKSTGNYHEDVKIKNALKLRELEEKLPDFCTTFFRGINSKVGTRTQIGYAYDLLIFFRYIAGEKPVKSLKLNVLDEITKFDIENYLDYLSYYDGEDGIIHTNDERGKARKLSAVKGIFNYFYESEKIKENPASIVHGPKIHDKNIIKLDPNEVAILLDLVENGSDKESNHQKAYHTKTMPRDLCILTLLLGTGMRVSECVGINLKDIDFDNGKIKIVRKGGNESNIYFGDEVEDALLYYLDFRKRIIPNEGSEDALFLSMQNKRITVRAVEKLVKKYASYVTTLKKITPHKLRSTYGTTLYQESGDIYLVASVLGHKDVNTTKKHYASMDEDTKRKAANIVKLRKD